MSKNVTKALLKNLAKAHAESKPLPVKLSSEEINLLYRISFSVLQGKFPKIKKSQVKSLNKLVDCLGVAIKVKITWDY